MKPPSEKPRKKKEKAPAVWIWEKNSDANRAFIPLVGPPNAENEYDDEIIPDDDDWEQARDLRGCDMPNVLRNKKAWKNWAFCVIHKTWFSVAASANVLRHMNGPEGCKGHRPGEPVGFMPVSVAEARAHIVLFFLDANIANRQIENPHLRRAVDMSKITNRRVLMQTCEDLDREVETEPSGA
jgi:hypothetical protein